MEGFGFWLRCGDSMRRRAWCEHSSPTLGLLVRRLAQADLWALALVGNAPAGCEEDNGSCTVEKRHQAEECEEWNGQAFGEGLVDEPPALSEPVQTVGEVHAACGKAKSCHHRVPWDGHVGARQGAA